MINNNCIVDYRGVVRQTNCKCNKSEYNGNCIIFDCKIFSSAVRQNVALSFAINTPSSIRDQIAEHTSALHKAEKKYKPQKSNNSGRWNILNYGSL